jgi:hypothetical protein
MQLCLCVYHKIDIRVDLVEHELMLLCVHMSATYILATTDHALLVKNSYTSND